MTSPMAPPRLQKPGAGLPWHEAWLARFVLMPFAPRKTTWEQSNERFRRECERILAKVSQFDPARDPGHARLLETPVLIPRVQGIEDSSRYWSVVMTMEHLIIVGQGMTHIIRELTQGRAPGVEVDIAKVKPTAKLTAAQAVPAFRAFLDQTLTQLRDPVLDRGSQLKQHHPWFGPLTAHQWNFLMGIHQTSHRKQIEEILRLCENGSRS